MDIMKLTHRQVIDTLDAEYWQSFCIRWPHLDRERTMTDAEIIEQGHRIELRKALLWGEDALCEMSKKCWAVRTERYCVRCKRIRIKELEGCGYLQMLGDSYCGMRRTEEMKELTNETKSGIRMGQGH